MEEEPGVHIFPISHNPVMYLVLHKLCNLSYVNDGLCEGLMVYIVHYFPLEKYKVKVLCFPAKVCIKFVLRQFDVVDCSEELLRQQSYAIKNQLGHPKPPTRGFGTQRPLLGSLLAPRWFFMA